MCKYFIENYLKTTEMLEMTEKDQPEEDETPSPFLTPTERRLSRAIETIKLKPHQALRLIHNAWARGKKVDELSSALQQKYAKNKHYRGLQKNPDVRIYSGYLFLFTPEGDVLNVYQLSQILNRKPVKREICRKERRYPHLMVYEAWVEERRERDCLHRRCQLPW